MKKILFLVLSMATGFTCAMDRDLPEDASIEEALEYGLRPTQFELSTVHAAPQAQQSAQQQQDAALTSALQAVRDQLSQRYPNIVQEGRDRREDAKRTGRIAKSRALRPYLSRARKSWRFDFGW